jgi:ribosomal protein S27E
MTIVSGQTHRRRHRPAEVDSRYETIRCKGCGTQIVIQELEGRADTKAYSRQQHFNAEVPCQECEDVFSYGAEDIKVVDSVQS